MIGDVRDISRFPARDRFAACNGTAPVEVSSGNRVIYRLSLRGNRRLNHAIHRAAVTQIRHAHRDGRAYYDKKIAEGKTPKEALRFDLHGSRCMTDALAARTESADLGVDAVCRPPRATSWPRRSLNWRGAH